jgi:hypothetical protein
VRRRATLDPVLDAVIATEAARVRRLRTSETEPPPMGCAVRVVEEVDDWFALQATKQGGR